MRCYNGCPDTQLQRHMDEQSRVRDSIVRAGYSVTYFPNGEFYMAFDKKHLPMTKECGSLHAVATELKVSV